MATNTRKLADLLANIDNNSKITTGGLLDATITAADLADDSVGAAEIIDDAVTAAAIADDAVGSAAIADAAVDTARLAASAVTSAKIAADTIPVKPHIEPGLLYPAVHGALDGSTGLDFTDTGNTGHLISKQEGTRAYHTTAEKKNGNSSMYFTGSVHDDMTFPDHADFNFGTTDLTYEFYVKAGDQEDTYVTFLTDDASKVRVGFGDSATNLKLGVYWGVDGTWHQGTSDMSDDTDWHHCAVVRQGANLRLYVDGVQETVVAGKNDAVDCTLMRIGTYNKTTKRFKGYLDQIRISNTARYPDGTSFTPPAAHFTSDANTKFLLQSNIGSPHSGAYGTAQSDGKKYYYTDIEGSKPIKDPRIGVHYGSTRHTFKSIQKRLQETGAHHEQVWSIDGRDWARGVKDWGTQYNDRGEHILMGNTNADTGAFMEVTGYFNVAHLLAFNEPNRSGMDVHLDGALPNTLNDTQFSQPASDPRNGRYCDPMSLHVLNIGTVTTPGIHTIKCVKNDAAASGQQQFTGVEFIAQDTTSTANKSKLQIPAQNVVSYGKKFALSAAAQHYNPFDGMSGAKTLTQLGTYIDTGTSLGMENWKAGTSNYYRPFNGGRVVKWIASDGTIKTSVTMMPPNAQNLHRVASAEVSNAHIQAGTNDDVINFNTESIQNNQLSELAKSWYWREFGNGAGNGGTNASGVLADASMLSGTADNIAHVMEDGLTSLVCRNAQLDANPEGLMTTASGWWTFTFIGTGVGMEIVTATTSATTDDDYDTYIDGVKVEDSITSSSANWYNKVDSSTVYAQNLPYGTHILRTNRVSADAWNLVTRAFDVHQPKMPPIPEDACIIADYMLMANFVAQGDGTDNASAYKISKGTRQVSMTKDFKLHDGDDATWSFTLSEGSPTGYNFYSSNGADGADTITWRLPAFGTNWVHRGYKSDERVKMYLDTTDKDSASTKNNESEEGSYAYLTTALEPGAYKFGVNAVTGQNGNSNAFDVVTPIHTSHHYRTFETPFLNHMIGGDRNVEQTHLICSADGKTWDELTRDTSYIGPKCNLRILHDTAASTVNEATLLFKIWRGNTASHGNNVKLDYGTKGFAIAYDRIVVLEEGWYTIAWEYYSNVADKHPEIWVNNAIRVKGRIDPASHLNHLEGKVFCYRGDYIQFKSDSTTSEAYYNRVYIEKEERV